MGKLLDEIIRMLIENTFSQINDLFHFGKGVD